MTVKELRDYLETMPQGAEVEIEITGDDGIGSYVASPCIVRLELDGFVTISSVRE